MSMPMKRLLGYAVAIRLTAWPEPQRVADTMPDARVQVVPDAGHSPHLDQPAIIAEAVETFTKKT
jgi:pimeloyl-ACP methyl ester carboxylesterase